MAYLIPEADALAINAALAAEGPYSFAYENAAGWIHLDGQVDNVPVDMAAILSGLGLASPLAAYLAGVPEAESKHCKIYRYLPSEWGDWDRFEPPINIDYRTGLDRRLEHDPVTIRGELQSVTYYDKATVNPDGSTTFEDPVVREDYVYTRDAANFALFRDVTVTWILEDETDHAVTKPLHRTYTPEGRIAEGKKRRGYAIDEATFKVSGLLIETELANNGGDYQATLDMGRALLSAYQKEIADFTEAALQDLYTAVDADVTFAWLDNTPASLGGVVSIRDVLLDAINIWGL